MTKYLIRISLGIDVIELERINEDVAIDKAMSVLANTPDAKGVKVYKVEMEEVFQQGNVNLISNEI